MTEATPTTHLCVVCNIEPVDADQGFDTCSACESILTGIAPGAIARRRAAAPVYDATQAEHDAALAEADEWRRPWPNRGF